MNATRNANPTGTTPAVGAPTWRDDVDGTTVGDLT